MNAGKHKKFIQILVVLVIGQAAFADPARDSTSQGNKLYKQGNYNEAINGYEQALTEAPGAMEPKFNQANSYYRLDDLSKALDLYREVSAESKDMKLVAKAKYNLGNTYFQRGSKQKDSDLQKAIDDMKTAISSWRGVLDIEPENQKAAKNIEVARLTIKDLLDQLKSQQQNDPNQPHDPNQSQQQNQSQQSSQENTNQTQDQKNQQEKAGQDPNEPKDLNEPQDQQKEQKKEEQSPQVAPDTTAQEILDKEQRQRKERQIFQPSPWQKVEKDW